MELCVQVERSDKERRKLFVLKHWNQNITWRESLAWHISFVLMVWLLSATTALPWDGKLRHGVTSARTDRQRTESKTNRLISRNNHNVCENGDNNGDAHDSVMDNVLLR